jgi:hypothetical protein
MASNRKTIWIVLVLLILFSLPIKGRAADKDVTRIAQQMEEHFHVKQTRIPLWGTINGAARVIRPWKGLGFSLAVFEDCHFEEADFNSFEERLQQMLGEGWQPFVRVRSRRDHEQTIVLSKPAGKKFELLVVALESSEATVVKMRISWKEFSHWVEDKSEKNERAGL